MTNTVCVVIISLGYNGVFIARDTTDYCEGEATFYRTTCFSLESSESLLLTDVISQVCCWQSYIVEHVYIT